MRQVIRKRPVVDYRENPNFMTFLDELDRFYQAPSTLRRQKEFSLQPSSGTRDAILQSLFEQFNSKCAYCEKLVTIKTAVIDHFRPAKTLQNPLDKDIQPDGYWWLAFAWNNLYLSCAECNQYKSSFFPVRDRVTGRPEKINPWGPDDRLKTEKYILIDPCVDVPQDHIKFKNEKCIANDERGRTTIELLQLNRHNLLVDRKHAAQLLSTLLDFLKEFVDRRSKAKPIHNAKLRSLLNELISIFNLTCPFTMMKLSILGNWINENGSYWNSFLNHMGAYRRNSNVRLMYDELSETPAFKENISSSTWINYKSGKTSQKSKLSNITDRIFIRKVEINNFKSIRNLTIDFNNLGKKARKVSKDSSATSGVRNNWLMLLGENGVGKSSLLQAVTLALAGSDYLRSLDIDASEFVLNGKLSGRVRITFEGNKKTATLSFSKKSKKFTTTLETAQTNILAYGSTRIVSDKLHEEKNSLKVAAKNLFDPTIGLTGIESWLSSLTPEHFDTAAISIKKLLSKGNDDTIIKEGKKIFVINTAKQKVSIASLSDGYKYTIALAVDIMKRLIRDNPRFEVSEGIVLVDEIGNHLHPAWKLRVVKQLKTVFPHLQFITTTHEPLCLKGLEPGEIVVFKKKSKGGMRMITDLPSPKGLRPDQILASEYFGLNSTIDPEVEEIFDEYYKLLATRKRTNEQAIRLNELTANLKELQQLGTSQREELMLNAIDKVLALNKKEDKPAPISTLKTTTESIIKEIWDQLRDNPMQVPEVIINEVKFKPTPGRFFDDPWKGVFGGRAIVNDRHLSAIVDRIDKDWFGITIRVTSTNANRPLTGEVRFYLHDSFANDKPLVDVAPHGVAELYVEAYGAFTIGAEVDGGATRLELDLSQDTSYPKEFISN